MSLFKHFMYSKRPDRHIENSDWVFVEAPAPPASPSTAQNNSTLTSSPPLGGGDGGAAPPPPPTTQPLAVVTASQSQQAEAGLVVPPPSLPPPPPFGDTPHCHSLAPSVYEAPPRMDGHIADHPPHGARDSPPPERAPFAPLPRVPPREHGGPVVGKSSLKPLNWNKVNRAIEGSLWEELQTNGQPQSASEIDVSELEELFSSMSPKIGGSKEVEKRKAFSSIHEKVQLIDPLRANNTETMLTEVKLPLHCIVDAVLVMDDTVIDVDQVENLLKFFPTKEEMEILKSYTGDQDKLGKCEQYFLELMKVPRMESKLNAFMFKIQFSSKLAGLMKSLNTINSACDEVKKSVKMKEIMKRILYLGNTLNEGTSRGSAVGFKLDSLLKLTDTRASNSNKTLMHYLCMLVATKSPDLLDFHEELVNLEAATKVFVAEGLARAASLSLGIEIQLKNIAEEMLTLSNEVQKLKHEVNACMSDGPISAGFLLTLKDFNDHAEQEVKSANKFSHVVGRNADGLVLYFGEDPTRCPFEQATQILFNFVRLFQKCHKENLEQAELKRKESQAGDGNGIVRHTLECPSNPSLNLV